VSLQDLLAPYVGDFTPAFLTDPDPSPRLEGWEAMKVEPTRLKNMVRATLSTRPDEIGCDECFEQDVSRGSLKANPWLSFQLLAFGAPLAQHFCQVIIYVLYRHPFSPFF